MRISTIWGRPVVCAAFAVALLWSIPGVAQGQLIAADYGAGDQRIDVTSRIQSLVQNGYLNVRVNNDTMGVPDPARGHVKELRLHLRDGNRIHDYIFRENSVANVALSAGGPMGTGGGRDRDYDDDDGNYGYDGVMILQAWYGANDSVTNVTQKLRSYINNGQIGLRVNNDSMAVDPAPEQRKALFVLYRVNGKRKAAIIQENGVFAAGTQ